MSYQPHLRQARKESGATRLHGGQNGQTEQLRTGASPLLTLPTNPPAPISAHELCEQRAKSTQNLAPLISVMSSQDDFKEAMHDIYKHTPLIALEDQELLQSWVTRLAVAGSGSGKDQRLALDYARYLAYQLQRKQLRFPFSQPPAEGSLTNLKDVLFGMDSLADDDSLNASHPVATFKSLRGRVSSAQNDYSFSNGDQRSLATWSSGSDSAWDSHNRSGIQGTEWDSHVIDPKGERGVVANLEELANDAALWLLLTRICPHTRDGGALMHAVVAEELAEWSARLAAEQTANRENDQDVDEDWEWGPRADRRADHWHEVNEVKRSIIDEGGKGAELLVENINIWLIQQNRQLQAEHAQLHALIDELRDIQRQVLQSQRWRESQFEIQNRALQAEVAALKQGIADNSKKMDHLKLKWRQPEIDMNAAGKTSDLSEDSLNTSSVSRKGK